MICSYRLLYSKVYRARLLELAGTSGVASGACFAETSPQKFPDAAALRGPVDILNLRRNTRRFLETPGSLMWNRQSQDHQGETKQQNEGRVGTFRVDLSSPGADLVETPRPG